MVSNACALDCEFEERRKAASKLRLIEGELRTDEALRLQARLALPMPVPGCAAAGAIGLSEGYDRATVKRWVAFLAFPGNPSWLVSREENFERTRSRRQ